MGKIWAAAGVVGVELALLVWVIGSDAVEWMTSALPALGQ
jgi:hypothetical protein